MKFFTLDWWEGVQESVHTGLEIPNPSKQYRQYFTTIQTQLPKAFMKLFQENPLHDAWLRVYEYQHVGHTLQLVFDGDDQHGSPRKIVLTYHGVERIATYDDPKHGLVGPRGYGDFGYEEVEMLPDGLIEHRLLFSSGIELHITCDDMDIIYECIAKRN